MAHGHRKTISLAAAALLSQAALRVLPVRLSVSPSVRLSVGPIRAPYSETKRWRKTRICVNVSQDRSNRFADYQLKWSKVKVVDRKQKLKEIVDMCHTGLLAGPHWKLSRPNGG